MKVDRVLDGRWQMMKSRVLILRRVCVCLAVGGRWRGLSMQSNTEPAGLAVSQFLCFQQLWVLWMNGNLTLERETAGSFLSSTFYIQTSKL